MSYWIWCLSIFSIWIDIYQSCPTGYTFCADENNVCSLTGTNIIAYGKDGHRWHYETKIGSFTCNNDNGNPILNIAKECCYQNDHIHVPNGIANGINWSPGQLQCNQAIQAYFATDKESHVWQFTIYTELTDVRFDNCDSQAQDLQLYLYNNTAERIAGCDDCGSCGTRPPYLSDFTQSTLAAGTYWVKIAPFDNFNTTDAGNYTIRVGCPDYGGVLTCSQNTISGATTSLYPYPRFAVITKSTHDIEINSCGTSFDTRLFIYSDSTYTTQIVGGDNDSCGRQETFTLVAREAGIVYIRLDRYCGGPCPFGPYIVSIRCNGSYPTSPPTPAPTNPFNIAPPTISPSHQPSVSPTSNPSLSPTQSSIPTTLHAAPTIVLSIQDDNKMNGAVIVDTSTTLDINNEIDDEDTQSGNDNSNNNKSIIVGVVSALSVLCCVCICGVFIAILYLMRRRNEELIHKNPNMKSVASASASAASGISGILGVPISMKIGDASPTVDSEFTIVSSENINLNINVHGHHHGDNNSVLSEPEGQEKTKEKFILNNNNHEMAYVTPLQPVGQVSPVTPMGNNENTYNEQNYVNFVLEYQNGELNEVNPGEQSPEKIRKHLKNKQSILSFQSDNDFVINAASFKQYRDTIGSEHEHEDDIDNLNLEMINVNVMDENQNIIYDKDKNEMNTPLGHANNSYSLKPDEFIIDDEI